MHMLLLVATSKAVAAFVCCTCSHKDAAAGPGSQAFSTDGGVEKHQFVGWGGPQELSS
jgi:hypothetical protein